MTWGIYQDYLTGRAQGGFRGGLAKYTRTQDKLHNQLYRSFGLANKVRYCVTKFCIEFKERSHFSCWF